MTRSRKADPLENKIVAALDPGTFIPDRKSFDFEQDLQEAADAVAEIMDTEPQRAASLFQIFIAACHEKAEEVDDSSGSLGMFVEQLFVHWIKSCQAADINRQEMVNDLAAWIEDDPYGFCYRLEDEVVHVMDEESLDIFAEVAMTKCEAPSYSDANLSQSAQDADNRQWTRILKTIYAAQGRVEDYVLVSGKDGPSAKDCKVLAETCYKNNQLIEALKWVEHGLTGKDSSYQQEISGYELSKLKRTILSQLDRSQEAMEDAWTEFIEYPHLLAYEEFMQFVPDQEKEHWHQKAMQVADQAELELQLELWVELGEITRLKLRIAGASDQELEGLSHFFTEQAAAVLHESNPHLAAKVYKALAMRILKAGKSKYYNAALNHLEQARSCWLQSNESGKWQTLVDEVRSKHARKYSFMPAFEQIVSKGAREKEPPFLDKAKKRWMQKKKTSS